MNLSLLLEQVRAFYLKRFFEIIEELKEESKQVIIENELLDEKGELAVEGFFTSPLRQDIYVIEDFKVTESILVDTEYMLNFQPITFSWAENLKITINPFQWNYVVASLNKPQENINWALLRTWFSRAFSPKEIEEEVFLGSVHFISDPNSETDRLSFEIDFGSAPVSSMEEFFDVIHEMGFSTLEIN